MMKNRFAILNRPLIRRVIYLTVLFSLIVLSIVQIYEMWTRMERPNERMHETRQVEPDTQASLLEPFDMYLTRDGLRFARINSLSGFYQDLWSVSRILLNRMVRGGFTVTEVSEADLPAEQAGIVLQYASPLPADAVRELLLIENEIFDVEQIIMIPSQSRNETVTLYLIGQDWEHILRAESTVNISAKAAQNFAERFMDCLDAVPIEYINAHSRFPAIFQGGCFVRELESSAMYHIPEISVSYVTDELLDIETATAYVMHFFEHPDVARQVEQDEQFIWYADEKHTVRYDASGLLQYVSTLEPSEREMLPLQEAYQMACGFLKEDLAYDQTLLQEIYLCGFERSEDGVYTFSWNYAYNHIPFAMSEETKRWTDLPYPIQIKVEGTRVRYYHRYLLDKSMEADGIFSVKETYIEALDSLLETLPEQTRIWNLSLEYEEIEGRPVLCWKVETDQGTKTLPAGEVRV